MSTPSTPRRTASRQTSPVHSDGNGDSPALLTPGKKIKALLAGFDSDSGSEDGNNTGIVRQNAGLSTRSDNLVTDVVKSVDNDDDDEDEEDFPVAPRGRLAARLQAAAQAPDIQDDRVEIHFNESSTRLGGKASEGGDASDNSESSSGAIRTSARRTRALRSKDSSCDDNASHRAFSPLFVPQDSPISRVDSPMRDVARPEHDGVRPQQVSRLQALVAQKRKMREEKERLEAEKQAERMQRLSDSRVQFTSDVGDAEEDDGDDDGESSRRLTQQSRPARKASKKALLEMSRETQRMSRNMQLAHKATTKKKFTLSSFVERFNQKCNVDKRCSSSDSTPESRNLATANSADHSDNDIVELDKHSTPPTSPLPQIDKDNEVADSTGPTDAQTGDETFLKKLDRELLADLDEVNAEIALNAPKHSAPDLAMGNFAKRTTIPRTARQIQVQLSRQAVAENQKNDSDSDLEIVTSPGKARKLAVFENFSSKSSASSDTLRKLKLLARITSPKKNRTLTRAEHEAWLLRQARVQAAKEREEKIAALRAKGVIIQTAEEKARMEDDVEDLMEKAREEGEAIARKEKAAKKKGNGGEDALDVDDSEEDGEYEEDGADEEDDESDDNEELVDEEELGEEDISDRNEIDGGTDVGDQGLIDNQAHEANDSEGDISEISDHGKPTEIPLQRRRKPKLVVSDDEDDEQPTAIVQTPMKPHIPGLEQQRTPLIGLSQAFAMTLGDDQENDEEEDSLAVLRKMPEFDTQVGDLLEPVAQAIVRDSQGQDSGTLDLLADFTQPDAGIVESPAARTMSEFSQIPEPSQDVGFVMSPFDQRRRFLTQRTSSIDTVSIHGDDSPVAKGGGKRLMRGAMYHASDGDDSLLVKPSAFDVMRKAASKRETPFDKKKSKAKDVVDEAAEESEDEFAGLGGASDDDSGEDDELDLTMINDNSAEVVDEQELAALNASHERQRDEGEVNKLLHDITTGALRRKRGMGDGMDLSDSDDERIAARRRAKQREFAKMRKALLADDNVHKIADDPKKQAFFKTIEDRETGDEFDFLRDEYGESNSDTGALVGKALEDSQSNSEEPGKDGRKRPLDTAGSSTLNHPPAKSRRTGGTSLKRPSTLAEIRAQVSSLIGVSESQSLVDVIPDSQPDIAAEEGTHTRSGSEESFSRSEPVQASNPRRRGRVVDRLSLRRAASSNAAMSAAAAAAGPKPGSGAFSSKVAFYSTTAVHEFKRPPPLLLRRTTTNSSSSSASTSSSSSFSSGATAPAAVAVVKSGANVTGKKGAVNYYAAARERERELQLKRNLVRESAASRKAIEEHRARREEALTGLIGRGQWE
ncbi:hypothetical protein PRK78_005664 [Emydomyces testavorans]|uniref:DNA replication checkpoint mediator MRC1 domain-containing protein n=1 Tax=Emydomyces testavorans TaxID=2070801 RepID=A0AAF0IMU2_9EURO|nr:hypothetical protein PRK78_005664 [Emydomyces testavorans]